MSPNDAIDIGRDAIVVSHTVGTSVALRLAYRHPGLVRAIVSIEGGTAETVMTASDAIDIGRDAIIVSLKLGGPIMLLALVVGVVISLVQALTQIQETTLTFVPKIVAILIAMLLLMPFMLTTLTTFTERLFDRVISG